MRRTLLVLAIVSSLMSCDPSSLMEANITNNTSQDLTVSFISKADSVRAIVINRDQIILYQDGFSTTGSFLEPSLTQYDYEINREDLYWYIED